MKKPLKLLLVILIFMNGLAWGGTAEEWYLKGYAADATNNYDEAIKCYTHAVAIEPDYTDAHYNLGLVYGEKGMLDEAIAAYKKVTALDPDYIEAHYNIGVVYDRKGMLKEAIAAYKKVGTLYGGHLDSHNGLALTYMKKGMLDKFIAEYKKILAIDPGHVKTYAQLGVVYRKKGSYVQSVKHFYRAGALSLKHFYKSVMPFFKFAVWRLKKNLEKLKSRWLFSLTNTVQFSCSCRLPVF